MDSAAAEAAAEAGGKRKAEQGETGAASEVTDRSADVSVLGISAKALMHLRDSLPTRNWRTSEVVKHVIIPRLCAGHATRYVDLLDADERCMAPANVVVVTKQLSRSTRKNSSTKITVPYCFVSHAWGMQAYDLLTTLIDWGSYRPPEYQH